jgi:hypothetical protein
MPGFIFMLILLFVLVDVHTLFVLFFHNHLSLLYVFSGASLAILKGLIFFLPGRDIFSFFDIVTGVLMLFLLFGELWMFLYVLIVLFLSYKIVMSFGALR